LISRKNEKAFMEEKVFIQHGSVQELMTPSLFRIGSFKKESNDVFTMSFQPVGDVQKIGSGRKNGVHFAPGQFNMIYVFGLGEVPLSISGDPAPGFPLVHTTRAVGAVTKGMFSKRVGDVVGIRGPFGNSWPVEKAVGKDLILIAGGIGLAPLRPVIYNVLTRRNDFKKVILLLGSRSPSEMIFKDEIKQWKKPGQIEAHITVDRGSASWQGSIGVVTRFIPRIAFDPDNAIAMICGPEIMMHFTIDALQKRQMSLDKIYVSMERNMKCAAGFCGHCQFGSHFICKNGPIFPYSEIRNIFRIPEV
jgi:NAD(P)H-flavin reductase